MDCGSYEYQKIFSNLRDKIEVAIVFLIASIVVLLEIIGIALVILVPFVLSVGGICFIIWFFFECLGGVI